MLNADHGDFVRSIERMNQMYRLQVSSVPTLVVLENREDGSQERVTAAQRLSSFKETLLDEINEIDPIIMRAMEIERGGASWETVFDVLTAIADLTADLIVFCVSEQRKFGIPPAEVMKIVMASNMSKLQPDGTAKYDEHGKFLKGPNYWKPEPAIRAMLASMIGAHSVVMTPHNAEPKHFAAADKLLEKLVDAPGGDASEPAADQGESDMSLEPEVITWPDDIPASVSREHVIPVSISCKGPAFVAESFIRSVQKFVSQYNTIVQAEDDEKRLYSVRSIRRIIAADLPYACDRIILQIEPIQPRLYPGKWYVVDGEEAVCGSTVGQVAGPFDTEEQARTHHREALQNHGDYLVLQYRGSQKKQGDVIVPPEFNTETIAAMGEELEGDLPEVVHAAETESTEGQETVERLKRFKYSLNQARVAVGPDHDPVLPRYARKGDELWKVTTGKWTPLNEDWNEDVGEAWDHFQFRRRKPASQSAADIDPRGACHCTGSTAAFTIQFNGKHYRPFRNVREFEANHDRWVFNPSNGTFRRIDCYSHKGANGMSWESLLRNRVWADTREPCGLLVQS